MTTRSRLVSRHGDELYPLIQERDLSEWYRWSQFDLGVPASHRATTADLRLRCLSIEAEEARKEALLFRQKRNQITATQIKRAQNALNNAAVPTRELCQNALVKQLQQHLKMKGLIGKY
jgi:hypothetical protein